jgi:membrane protease YdiL (CAAX protease family)
VRDAIAACAVVLGFQVLLPLVRQQWYVPPGLAVGISWAVELLLIVGLLGLMLARGARLRSLMCGRQHGLVEIVVGMAFVVPLLASMLVLNLVLVRLLGPPQTGARAVVLAGDLYGVARICFAALAVSAGPLLEELLMRGLVLGSLEARIGRAPALLLQAAAFSSLHHDSLHASVLYFWIGLVLGVVYLWRRSLLGVVALHAGFNVPASAWLVALLWINAHVPAATWQQAERPPEWWSQPPLLPIPDEATVEKQYEVALTLGSRGPQLWKVEALAFQKVLDRFPNDARHGAKALGGIQQIYSRHLADPRRAIVVGREVLRRFPDQPETCFGSLLLSAGAHVELGDFAEAQRLAQQAGQDYRHVTDAAEQVQEFLDELARRHPR